MRISDRSSDVCSSDLISHPTNGTCVFRHGAEVYHLVVKAEKYKEEMFQKE